MGAIASQITSLFIVYSAFYSGADQRKHQSSASLAFVRGIHRGPVNSPHKWPVTRKMFPFDDVIMVGEFGPVMRGFAVSFVVGMDELLNKQSIAVDLRVNRYVMSLECVSIKSQHWSNCPTYANTKLCEIF